MSFGVRYAPTINEQSYTYNLIRTLSDPVSATGGPAPAPSQTGYAYTIDFDTNYTQKLKSIIINKDSTINTSDITCALDTAVDIQQIYTIGKSIQSTWVAVGLGTNTIAYSTNNGESWNGLDQTIFDTEGLGVCWNGELWVAVGTSPTPIVYSDNGINWTSVSSSPLITGYGIAWNGNMFVAVGSGSINTIATSTDGTVWTGVGKTIFSTSGLGVAWNGQKWVAVGEDQSNTIAYSSNGTTWTPLGKTIFSVSGNGVAWNGQKWVAVGTGTNTIAYSENGTVWIGADSTTNIFSGGTGRGVCWNGEIWVAVGESSNTIAWSDDGTNWNGLGNTIFGDSGNGVSWNGNIFIAVGNGTNTIATSKNGKIWTPVVDSSTIFSSIGRGVSWNSVRDINIVIEGGSTTSSTITPSQTLILNKGDKLDVFAPLYYNSGYNSATITINSSFV